VNILVCAAQKKRIKHAVRKSMHPYLLSDEAAYARLRLVT
jgi:hypothetical protein